MKTKHAHTKSASVIKIVQKYNYHVFYILNFHLCMVEATALFGFIHSLECRLSFPPAPQSGKARWNGLASGMR